MRLPKPTRADIARARDRAHALERALGLTPRPDSEFPTHWHVEGEHDGRGVHITLGSARLARGVFRSESTEFMVVRINAPTWLPEGAVARPAARTVWDWREGLPGEAANLPTKSAAGYVLHPVELVPELGARVAEAIDRLPCAGWVHATSTGLEVRVGDREASAAPADVAAALLGWDGFRA